MKYKFILVVIIILFLIGLLTYTVDRNKDGEIEIKRTERQLEHSELLIKDIEIGKGNVAKMGDTLVLHYIGMLEDGTVFDSSYDRGRVFTFTMGQHRVILGWEIGLEGMREGGKRHLTIPPEFAYGESGVRGMVPPNSVIVFEVELIEIKN